MRLFSAIFIFAALCAATPAAAQHLGTARIVIYTNINRDLVQGTRALNRGSHHIAARKLERAVAADLSDEHALIARNNLCIAYHEARRLEDALDMCLEAVKLARAVGNMWEPYNNLGNVYLAQSKPEEAVGAFERGLRISPNNRTIRRNLAIAERRLQDSTVNALIMTPTEEAPPES